MNQQGYALDSTEKQRYIKPMERQPPYWATK